MISEDAARELWRAMGGSWSHSPAYSEVLDRVRGMYRACAELPDVPHGPGLVHRGRNGAPVYPTLCCGQTLEEAEDTDDTWTWRDEDVTCPRFTGVASNDGRCSVVLASGQRCQLRAGHREGYHIANTPIG